MHPFDVLVLVLGILLVLRAILSTMRTFVLPRAANDLIARLVFISVRRVFDLAASWAGTYRRRDRVMSYFGPFALTALPVVWLIIVGAGYSLIFWALGARPFGQAIIDSGSSLLTLGFASPESVVDDMVAFSEAVIGLGLVALLIAYLPTIYAAFSRRELLVKLLETRADSPPSPVTLISRLHSLHDLDHLPELWERWEQWYAEVEETHSSLTVVVHFRSQQPERSWVNAAGAVMDAAAIARSSLALPEDAHAELMLRAGSSALRTIADVFHLEFDHSPTAASPTRIDHTTFDAALDELQRAGVPLVTDRERAWQVFHRWRTIYDEPLKRLEELTAAPPAWWRQRGADARSSSPDVGAL